MLVRVGARRSSVSTARNLDTSPTYALASAHCASPTRTDTPATRTRAPSPLELWWLSPYLSALTMAATRTGGSKFDGTVSGKVKVGPTASEQTDSSTLPPDTKTGSVPNMSASVPSQLSNKLSTSYLQQQGQSPRQTSMQAEPWGYSRQLRRDAPALFNFPAASSRSVKFVLDSGAGDHVVPDLKGAIRT